MKIRGVGADSCSLLNSKCKALGLVHSKGKERKGKERKGKESEVSQSCPTLCDPMDCSLPGSSVHGIFQARALEWVAISFSRRHVTNIYSIIREELRIIQQIIF